MAEDRVDRAYAICREAAEKLQGHGSFRLRTLMQMVLIELERERERQAQREKKPPSP